MNNNSKNVTYSQAIVFVVGGGNLCEQSNIQEYARASAPKKNIVYGATELLNGEDFLKQLNELGKLYQ